MKLLNTSTIKKASFSGVTGIISSLFLTGQAHALNLCPTGFGNICNNADSNSVQNVIGTIINWIFVGVTIIALLYLIWGGFKWIISAGDKAKVEDAQRHIVNALIGLVLVFLSYIILNIVLAFFGTSISNIKFPTL